MISTNHPRAGWGYSAGIIRVALGGGGEAVVHTGVPEDGEIRRAVQDNNSDNGKRRRCLVDELACEYKYCAKRIKRVEFARQRQLEQARVQRLGR